MTHSVERAARAHTNLTVFHAVIILLESSLLHGDKAQADAAKIIRLCTSARQRQLEEYDDAKRVR